MVVIWVLYVRCCLFHLRRTSDIVDVLTLLEIAIRRLVFVRSACQSDVML